MSSLNNAAYAEERAFMVEQRRKYPNDSAYTLARRVDLELASRPFYSIYSFFRRYDAKKKAAGNA